MRRRIGWGGHQPCTACWNRNAVTRAGKASQRRSMVEPSRTPARARVDALASRVRSISHSRFRSANRSGISSLCVSKKARRRSVSARIWRLISSSVWAGTRFSVLVLLMALNACFKRRSSDCCACARPHAHVNNAAPTPTNPRLSKSEYEGPSGCLCGESRTLASLEGSNCANARSAASRPKRRRGCWRPWESRRAYVLFLALEDNKRSMQRRLTKLLGINKADWPRISCAHTWPRAMAGLIASASGSNNTRRRLAWS